MTILGLIPGRVLGTALVFGLALSLAVACNNAGGGAGTGEPPGQTPAGAAVEIRMVPALKFDKTELTATNGEVTITAVNIDTRNRHSFALFMSQSAAESGEAPLVETEICQAPCRESVTFQTPPPGEYFFRCQVHPTRMTGTFRVE